MNKYLEGLQGFNFAVARPGLQDRPQAVDRASWAARSEPRFTPDSPPGNCSRKGTENGGSF
jgi:hypothetical protein